MSQERIPLLLDNCCSEQEGCCRYNKDGKKPVIPTSTSLYINNEDNDPTCQLSNQPWKYKIVALLCAMFLAGKHIIVISNFIY
jgi:hypothetical protein